MFLDYVTIFIKAGNGGNGAVSFHREKYVANGGPDGGDGGHGGSIVFKVKNDMHTLIDFRFTKHFRAENGANGGGSNARGKNGKDLIICVPRGTVIKDKATGNVIADMYFDDETKVVLEGGRGGKGNAHFKSAQRKAPRFAQKGEPAQEHELILELKTIADVGLVGFPNVGKSTLLSVISAAKPKIANYHFTTLAPNLGVVKYHDDSFVVADIPGLIEGAAEGAGLGHHFLRHIERVRMILHLVDISGSEGRDPIQDYYKINEELKQYSEKLSNLPQIVCANKADLLENEQVVQRFEKETGQKVFLISAVIGEGVDALLASASAMLKTLPQPTPLEYEEFVYEREDANSFTVSEEEGVYFVTGGLIDRLTRSVNLDDYESFQYFQKVLKDKGIIKALHHKGAKDGDTVIVNDIEFEMVD